jgi:hypothetical protein
MVLRRPFELARKIGNVEASTSFGGKPDGSRLTVKNPYAKCLPAMMQTTVDSQRKLLTIADVFDLPERGICPLPVIPHDLLRGLKPGDQLELRRPDGSIKRIKLYGLGWPYPSQGGICIELGPALSNEDVPIATEVWTVVENPQSAP